MLLHRLYRWLLSRVRPGTLWFHRRMKSTSRPWLTIIRHWSKCKVYLFFFSINLTLEWNNRLLVCYLLLPSHSTQNVFNYCSFSNKYICVPLPQVDYSPGGPIRSTVLSESLWSNLEQQTSDLRHTLTIWRLPIVLLWLTAVSILNLVVYLHD